LYRSQDGGILLIDIPRSIEESQVLAGQPIRRRLRSAEPVSVPFPTPEPKDAAARQMAQAPSGLLAELMTKAATADALAELKRDFQGPLSLPRITSIPDPKTTTDSDADMTDISEYLVPERSRCLHGSIQEFKDRFSEKAPEFDLIMLDPPWPNRSAKRKRDGYPTVQNLQAARDLLSMIPIASHLAEGGLVAMWITNKHSLAEMTTSPKGLFDSWGLEVRSEWTWLKITTAGEPVYDVDSCWRKPWERLLVAGRKGSRHAGLLERRVLIAVPDIHSRKPSLRPLFDELFPPGYKALEIFARNLTAGWWSWGEEVLDYQHPRHWAEEEG